jgi:hypothetical protein
MVGHSEEAMETMTERHCEIRPNDIADSERGLSGSSGSNLGKGEGEAVRCLWLVGCSLSHWARGTLLCNCGHFTVRKSFGIVNDVLGD